jgi:hypothetical protein
MSLLKALGTLDFRREGSAWLGSSSAWVFADLAWAALVQNM